LANKNVGMGYYLKGQYLEALAAWDEALKIYSFIGDKRGIANMLSNQAAIYYNQGDDAKSLELDLKSLKISEEINDTIGLFLH
jgi:tetratricopeptide (TPR) repeat protein